MNLDFKVIRLHKLNGNGMTKAMCDVALCEEFVVKGFRVVQGKRGLFVSMPQDPGKDGKWYDRAYPLSTTIREELDKVILSAYENNWD
jgi:stage V sporulation protein G